jgi:hypothetical protein
MKMHKAIKSYEFKKFFIQELFQQDLAVIVAK